MKKTLGTLLLLLSAATFAVGQEQYSYNFTAPAGAIQTAYTNPSLQYYDTVENSTPPYPGGLPYPNGTFHLPPKPNHPLPIPVSIDGYMPGFVSASGDGTTAKLEIGQNGGWLRITAANGTEQAVGVGTPVWTWPATYPAEGESITLSMTAPITQVCNAICQAASGQLNFSSTFHFNWHVFPPSGGGCRSNCTQIAKLWVNDSPATIEGLSTVAILDKDQNRESVTVAEFRWPSWLRWLFGASEPVEIFF